MSAFSLSDFDLSTFWEVDDFASGDFLAGAFFCSDDICQLYDVGTQLLAAEGLDEFSSCRASFDKLAQGRFRPLQRIHHRNTF